jgi:hypothetical protein
MDWTITLVGLAATSALAVLFGWLGARPPNPARGPRLAPYRFLMLLSATGALLLLIHVRSLALPGPN